MAIDVAVLRALLRIESEGSQKAVQDVQKVEGALRNMGQSATAQAAEVSRAQATVSTALELVGKAAESASYQTQQAGSNLKAAVDDYRSIVQAVGMADARLKELGVTHEGLQATIDGFRGATETSLAAISDYNRRILDLSSSISDLTGQKAMLAGIRGEDAAREQLTAKIKQQTEEMERLKRARGEEEGRLGDASTSLLELETIQAAFDAAPGRATEVLAGIEKQSGSLSKELGGTSGKVGFLSQMFGRFNNGSGLTISNLASIVARATGLGIAAVVAVRAVTQLFQALGRIANKAIEAADATNLFSDATHAAAGSIQNFQGNGVALLAFLDKATNRWRSYGNSVEDASAASVAVARLANVAQFLDTTPGNEAQVLEMIQRSVETLNFDALRDLGIDVGRVNESFRKLANDGVPLATQRKAAYAEVTRQVSERTGEAIDQLNRERDTLAGLKVELDRMITSMLQTEEGRAAIRGLVGEIRNVLPVVAQLAYMFGVILVGGIRLATAVLPPLITGIINLSEATLTFGQHLPFFGKMIRTMAELAGVDLNNISEDFDKARKTLADLAEIEIPDNFFDNLMAELPGVDSGLEDVARRLQDIRQEASKGSGLAGQVQALGDAFVAMLDDLNPRTAMAGLNQFSSIIDTVINDGIESFEVFRLRAQAAFDLGFFNEAELAAANENFDNMERILGPIAQKAEELRTEQERLAASRLDPLQAEFAETESAVVSARSETQEFISVLNSIPAQVSTDVVVNYRTTGDPSGRGLIPGDLSQIRGGAATTGHRGSRGGGRRPPPPSPQPNTALSLAEQRRMKETIDAGATANQSVAADRTAADRAAYREWLEKQGRFGRSDRGGGGAANDSLATIEQIRAFMQEVNRAIGIAARGGVRIGTAGNAIPFEEGTFLNPQGGNLSVDTILIRGVWDFADPAAKRQIIRELQEALQALQAEV